MKNYYWSELFLIFVPEGREKTLAEMSREEYERWREELYSTSFAKFAEWLLSRFQA